MENSTMRTEKDGFGFVSVPSGRLWGAQTQRAVMNFRIGNMQAERMPEELIYALALAKKAAAVVNRKHEKIKHVLADAIQKAAEEVMEGKHTEEFPLLIWQSGSGTQTNMNMNEVLSNRAIQFLGGDQLGTKFPVHPNDHVNLSQSSNDTFPTAMHISTVLSITNKLIPSLTKLSATLKDKQEKYKNTLKIGRTHLQDATPMTVGQEISAFICQIDRGINRIRSSLTEVKQLAQGGTAVGTGLNCYEQFAVDFALVVSELTGLDFVSADNKFEALASNDAMVAVSASLNSMAVSLMKIANDIRLLGSGPRCGLGEYQLPSNEPGSSIMPGKVNPTQCEALSMVCIEVIGSHTTVTLAGSQGHLQLNVYKPVIAHNVLRSIRLLTDACQSFDTNCVAGLSVNEKHVEKYVHNSLMLITSLSPLVGYDKAAEIASYAYENQLSLRDACITLKYTTAEQFDAIVKPHNMTRPDP
eukprot:GHVS01039937.1.p1 GENE.GHVS01039937.1~~GHVS01039937.1.p1  ORF type:complete len:471 (+),score=53.03 GHVS01039937.1:76-1488(+)